MSVTRIFQITQATVLSFFFLFMADPYKAQAQTIRYVAIGDSFTIGTGVAKEEAWPHLLVKHLQAEGVDISLTANLARNGWRTEDVQQFQLPVLESLKPDFVTLLIGANDWVHEAETLDFRKKFRVLLEHLQKMLPEQSRLLILTIPDFSVTPQGKLFRQKIDASSEIAQYNQVIQEEAKEKGYRVIDLFDLSQEMGEDASLVAADGLHPSPKEHQRWEKFVYPVAQQMLTEKK